MEETTGENKVSALLPCLKYTSCLLADLLKPQDFHEPRLVMLVYDS